AMGSVRSIEITRSVRATQLGGLEIKKRQPIGLIDGKLVAVGDSDSEVLEQMLSQVDTSHAEVVTIYYGEEEDVAAAEGISADIQAKHPGLQVEVVAGGQPHYHYIISIE
ncbi:DAK2 domain-containing protein, partial [Chloroflexota bacterium]